jgi:hypothetical protein
MSLSRLAVRAKPPAFLAVTPYVARCLIGMQILEHLQRCLPAGLPKHGGCACSGSADSSCSALWYVSEHTAQLRCHRLAPARNDTSPHELPRACHVLLRQHCRQAALMVSGASTVRTCKQLLLMPYLSALAGWCPPAPGCAAAATCCSSSNCMSCTREIDIVTVSETP